MCEFEAEYIENEKDSLISAGLLLRLNPLIVVDHDSNFEKKWDQLQ